MTTGTKVFLAVFALLIGVLVFYYGVIMPKGPVVTGNTPAANVTTSGTPGAMVIPIDSHQPNPGLPAQRPTESHAEPGNHETVPAAPGSNDASGSPVAAGERATEAGSGGPATPPPADAAPSVIRSPLDVFPVGFTPNQPTHAEANTPVKIAASDPPGAEVKPVDLKPAPALRANPPTPIAVTDNKAAPKQSHTEPDSKKATPPQTFDYTVKSGDTMSSIAEDWFGDRNKWSLIAKENPLVDPSTLRIGQKLHLPPKDAQPAKVKEQVVPDKNTYIVRSGDTLAKIARELFNDVSKWEAIYNANKSVIGNDPANLKAGMKLTIPDLSKKTPATATKPKSA